MVEEVRRHVVEVIPMTFMLRWVILLRIVKCR